MVVAVLLYTVYNVLGIPYIPYVVSELPCPIVQLIDKSINSSIYEYELISQLNNSCALLDL